MLRFYLKLELGAILRLVIDVIGLNVDGRSRDTDWKHKGWRELHIAVDTSTHK